MTLKGEGQNLLGEGGAQKKRGRGPQKRGRGQPCSNRPVVLRGHWHKHWIHTGWVRPHTWYCHAVSPLCLFPEDWGGGVAKMEWEEKGAELVHEYWKTVTIKDQGENSCKLKIDGKHLN